MRQDSYRHLWADGTRRLAAAGIGQAQLDARLLLQHAISRDHAALLSALHEQPNAAEGARYRASLDRRAAGEPVSRITGRRHFHGLTLQISEDVLDPRPETELLVEMAISDFANRRELQFVDIGTGSGAIAIALLAAMPGWRGIATDLSHSALAIAARNAELHDVASRLRLQQSDFLAELDGRYDFIATNPPYVESDAIAGLAPEVRLHDPRLALDGGPDGLAAYRRIFAEAVHRIRPDGILYCEIGKGQRAACESLAATEGWRLVRVVRDAAGLERICSWKIGRNAECK